MLRKIKYGLTALVVFCAFLVKAQNKPAIIPPHSHNLIISDVEFSKDEKSLYSLGLEGSLIKWDIRTQTPLKKVITHSRETYQMALSNDGKRLATASMDSTIKIWDAEQLTLLNTIYTKDNNLSVSWSIDDSMIVTGGNSGIIQIYETKKFEFIEGLVCSKSAIYDAIFFRGNKIIMTSSKDGHVKMTLRGTGQVGMDLPMESPVKKLVTDKAQSALALCNLKGKIDVILVPAMQPFGGFKTTTNKALNKFEFVSEMDINSKKKLFSYVDSTGLVSIVDPSTLKMQQVLQKHHNFISQVKFSTSGNWLASVDSKQRIQLFNLEDFDVETSNYLPTKRLLPSGDYPNDIYFLKDSSVSFVGANAYNWSLKTGVMREFELAKDYSVFETSFKRTNFEAGELLHNSRNGILIVINKNDTTLIRRKEKSTSPDASQSVFHFNESWYYVNSKTNAVRKVKVNEKLKDIDAMQLSNLGTFLYAKGNHATWLDLKSGDKEKFKIETGASGISCNKGSFALSTFKNSFYTLIDNTWEVYHVKNESAITSGLISERYCLLNSRSNLLQVYDLKTKKVIHKKQLDVTSLKKIATNDAGNLFALVTTDRNIHLYEFQTKVSKIYDIFGLGDNGMMIANNNGYYMGTKNAYRSLSFNFKNEVYPLEQFDAYLNQPHLVLQDSPFADDYYVNLLSKAVDKRSKKTNTNTLSNLAQIPEIEISNKTKLTNVTDQGKLNLTFNITEKGSKVSRFNLFINDVPYFSSKGESVNQNTFTKQIDLVPENNKISCYVEDENGNQSLYDQMEIFYRKENYKPNLYLVSIGVSNYADTSFNLNYASKDAEDIEKVMANSEAYGKVFSKLILNKDVTKESFKELKSFLSKASKEDVILVFMAGHGTLNEDLDYYFASHDMQFDKPNEKGISYDDIQALLDELACVKKILLMDTCHSGEVDKEDVAFELTASSNDESGDILFRKVGNATITTSEENKEISEMAGNLFLDTRKSTGTTVISSSGGTEVSQESGQWKNGLFTYCLKLGILSGKADLDRNGRIMLSELQKYVNAQVYKLSKGKQKPTARSLNLSMDYRIY